MADPAEKVVSKTGWLLWGGGAAALVVLVGAALIARSMGESKTPEPRGPDPDVEAICSAAKLADSYVMEALKEDFEPLRIDGVRAAGINKHQAHLLRIRDTLDLAGEKCGKLLGEEARF